MEWLCDDRLKGNGVIGGRNSKTLVATVEARDGVYFFCVFACKEQPCQHDLGVGSNPKNNENIFGCFDGITIQSTCRAAGVN